MDPKPRPRTATAHIARVLHAPVKAVWTAWTDEVTYKKWWGPRGFTCPTAQLDVREGGNSLLAMHEEKTGKTTWSISSYLKVEQNK